MAANNMNNLTTLIKRYVMLCLCIYAWPRPPLHPLQPSLVSEPAPFTSGSAIAGQLLIRALHRLEAATSRLEDMAQPTSLVTTTSNGTGAASTSVAGAMGATPGNVAATSPERSAEVLPPSIEGFDELINGPVTKFVNLSDELGGVVAEQVGFLRRR